jgi:hypothetical protein
VGDGLLDGDGGDSGGVHVRGAHGMYSFAFRLYSLLTT